MRPISRMPSARASGATTLAPMKRFRESRQCRAQACHLVRIPEWRLRRLRRSDRELPPRQSGLAWPRGASRAGGDRPLSCRRQPGKGAGLLRQRTPRPAPARPLSPGLHEGEQRARGARARGVGLARLSAQSRGGEKDPGPLRLNAHRGRPPGSHRQAALSGSTTRRPRRLRLRTSKLLPAAEQKSFAARIAVVKRGANAGKLLDVLPASATAGDIGLLYNRIQWLRRKDRDQEAWEMLLDAPREPDQADRPRRLVERAAPQLPHRAQLRTTSHCV